MTVNPLAVALILGFFVVIVLARFVMRQPTKSESPPVDPATTWLHSDTDRTTDRSADQARDQTLDQPVERSTESRVENKNASDTANDDPGTPDSGGDGDSN